MSREETIKRVLCKSQDRKSSQSLRRVVLSSNLLDYVCSLCGLGPKWNGKPLTLQLDHISGDPSDSTIENLRFLCPNCHTQTETYTGRKLVRFLDEEKVYRILYLLRDTDLSLEDIGKEVNISRRMVSNVKSGERWGHIIIDGLEEMRKRREHRGEGNTSARLTEDEVREIKILLREGKTREEIAYIYKRGGSTIDDIARERTWRHVII